MLDSWRDLVGALRSGRRARSPDDDLKVAAAVPAAPRSTSTSCGDDAAAVATYERILAGRRRGHVEAATRDPDDPRAQRRLAGAGRRAEAQERDPRRTSTSARRCCSGRRRSRRRCSTTRTPRSRRYRQVLDRSTTSTCTAMDALERLYIRLERWEPLKDVYAKKADLAEDPDDKKQMLYVLGAGLRPRARRRRARRSRPTRAILDLDADELPAIQALDRLYGQAERWYDLLGNLERQVELAETTGETRRAQVPHRPAVAASGSATWRARSRATARRSRSIRRTPRRCTRSTGSCTARASRCMAARVLEPIYEAAGEYEQARRRARGDGRAQRGSARAGRAAAPDRRAARARLIGNAHAAFDAYARALRDDSGNELTLGHLERLADDHRHVARRWRSCTAARPTSRSTCRARSICCRASRASTSRSSADVDEAIATLPPHPRRRVRQQAGGARARSAVHRRPSAWPRARRDPAHARSSSPTATTRSSRCSSGSARRSSSSSAICKGADRGLSRDPRGAPDARARRSARSRCMFLDGAPPDRDRRGPRAALRGGRRVREAARDPRGAARQARPARRPPGDVPAPRRAGRGQAATTSSARSTGGARRSSRTRAGTARVEEVERLARETACVGRLVSAYTRALERHRRHATSQRQTLLRLARVYEPSCATPRSAVETHLRVLEIDDEGRRRARRARPPVPGRRRCTTSWSRSCAAASRWPTTPTSSSSCTSAAARSSPRRSATSTQRSPATRRSSSRRAATGAPSRRSRRSTSAARTGSGCSRPTRSWSTSPTATPRWPTSTPAWRASRPTRSTTRSARSSCGAACSTSAARSRRRCGALADLHGRREQVGRAGRDHRAPGRGRARRPRADPALQAPRPRLGRQARPRAQRARRLAAPPTRSTATTSRRCARWRSSTARPRRGTSCRQTLRRIIEVGQTAGEISEDEMIELYAQLGQLEGDVLGRVDEAVDAWRRVLALDPTRLPRPRALEQLFIREARWEECIEVLEKRALVLEDEVQRRSRPCSRRRRPGRRRSRTSTRAAAGLRARPRDRTRRNATASRAARGDLPRSSTSGSELIEILLERVELHRRRRREQIRILNRSPRSTRRRSATRSARSTSSQAAFKRDYSHDETARELERLATATNRGRSCSTSTPTRQRARARGPRRGADLWVKIGRWYGEHLAHLEYAIHSVQQALRIDPSHTGALGGAGRAAAQARLVARADRDAAAARRRSSRTPRRRPSCTSTSPSCSSARCRTPMQAIARLPAGARLRRPRRRTALVALDRLYRRTEMWEPLIDVLGRVGRARADDRSEVVKLRLEIGRALGPAAVRRRPGDHGLPGGARHRSDEPAGAARPRAAVREDRTSPRSTSTSSRRSSTRRRRDAERSSLYERMAVGVGGALRQARPRGRVPREDRRDRRAQLRRVPRAGAPVPARRASGKRWSRPTAATSWRRPTSATRIELYCRDGRRSTRRSSSDFDRAIEAYNDVLSFDADEPRALDALGRLYEQIRSGTAPST